MPPRTKNKNLNFEQATARLEEIVTRVNNPETGLEEMIELAAEGLSLIRSSEQLLAEAELKIQKLEQADVSTAKPPHDDADFTLI